MLAKIFAWLCRTKAADMKEQLRWWLQPPDPTWQSREQRLDWLENSLSEARDVARGLQQHGALTSDSTHIAVYIHIVKVGHHTLSSTDAHPLRSWSISGSNECLHVQHALTAK